MRRFIDDDLIKWKEGKRRKPLILRGARQVGKTWSLKAFGNSQFGPKIKVPVMRMNVAVIKIT